MTSRLRLAGVLGIALALPSLQGCLTAAVALQAVPVAVGSVAMANAKDADPFGPQVSAPPPLDTTKLENVETQVLRAECGNAKAQYWLASALGNEFNASPNNVEVYKWYLLSQRGDFAPATHRLADLDASMPEAEVAEARARALAWKPRTENCPESG